MEVSGDPVKKTHKEKVGYRHNQDMLVIKRNGVYIKISKGREKLENAKTLRDLFFDNFTITTFFFKNRLLSLLDEVVEYNQQFKPKDVGVNVFTTSWSDWRRERVLNPKDIDNIILNHETKQKILKDVNTFCKRKDWYIKRFIPYKRGYLFYGSPGNGKTSTSLALAHYLKRDIYVFMIPEIKDDSTLKRLFNNVSDNAIILIEDIDSLFNKRETEEKISFSALLNCLDGVYYKENIITIMTTNHVEKLDPALIRDGRIDLRVEFQNPQEEQAKEYVELFYGTKVNGASYKDGGYSMATVQNYCLNNSEQQVKKILFKTKEEQCQTN